MTPLHIINVQLPSTIGTCLAELRGPKTQGRREPTTDHKFSETNNLPPPSPKNFRSVYHFRVKKFSRTSTFQMLYSDFTSIFYTKIRKFTPQKKYLALYAEIFLGAPPLFSQKYLMTHPLFLPAHPQS